MVDSFNTSPIYSKFISCLFVAWFLGCSYTKVVAKGMKKAEMILKVMDWTTPPGWRPFSSVLLYPLVEEKHKGITSFT